MCYFWLFLAIIIIKNNYNIIFSGKHFTIILLLRLFGILLQQLLLYKYISGNNFQTCALIFLKQNIYARTGVPGNGQGCRPNQTMIPGKNVHTSIYGGRIDFSDISRISRFPKCAEFAYSGDPYFLGNYAQFHQYFANGVYYSPIILSSLLFFFHTTINNLDIRLNDYSWSPSPH